MRSTEIVFGMPFSCMVAVLARSSKMRYGSMVCFGSLLYVLFAKVFAEDLKAVTKSYLSTKK